MPHVFIPPLLRPLTGNADRIVVEARTVREAIDALEAKHPGLGERLCDGDDLQPGLTVAVDGDVSPLGLLAKLEDDSEVHFLPAIGGG